MQLMEENAFLRKWLLNYCGSNYIEPPNLDKLLGLIAKCRESIDVMKRPYLPTEYQQRNKTPDDSTEPKILSKFQRLWKIIFSLP
jgi:hypothetical protein